MKEQTAGDTAPVARTRRAIGLTGLDRSLSVTLQKWLVPALFIALALLVTTGYGSGVQLNDGQAALHIDPLKFLSRLLHAWNPQVAMGTHTGFWVPYQTPYSWFYGLAQLLRIPQDFAQHAAVFIVYLGCLWSMYYCLSSLAPWLDEIALIAGSGAYLFNMYVALNSQAQIVWLLTYATLPAMVGVTARAVRGEMNLWRAALAIALLVLVGGGINPPLVAINVAVLAILVVVILAFDSDADAKRRILPVVAAASVAAVAVNLYWLVPFVDYFRGVWLGGVLTEGPSMHNAATSFVNVMRGLGHWATFVSFDGRAYFPWAAAYASGFFSTLLWFVPVFALGGIAFRRNQRPATLFFLLVTLVSIPLVVGYYHDEIGSAVTTPIYDQFYRNFPGFQMFRFSYKWVAGVEFGMAGLYGLAVYAAIAALREQIGKRGGAEPRRWEWVTSAAGTLAIAVPIVAFIPVITNKMNYPAQSLPSWEYREKTLAGGNQGRRVALFPTQFLEQFDWGNPQFYIEDSLIERPMIYGLLGSEPSEGADLWVRRAYRAAREGLPFSTDMLRVMGVDTILQRDDFIPTIDFSSPGEARFNSTTLTHDLLQRVIGASAVRADGPLRVYHVGGALPLLYGVSHPVVSNLPAFSDGYLGDVDAMAQGKARFDPPARSSDEFTAVLQSLSPILPAGADQQRDLAVNEALAGGIRVHPPSADAAWWTRFKVTSGGVYAVFAMDQGLLFDRAAPQTLEIDSKYLSLETTGGEWTRYGNIALERGAHWVSDGYLDPDLVVALVNVENLRAWQTRIAALERALPKNLAFEKPVYASYTRLAVKVPGEYRLRATAVGPYGPDGLMTTSLIRRGGRTIGAFPTDLSGTLPYVFGDGIAVTSPVMMPLQWYRDDSTAYQWQRGDPIPWFLFARDAHVRVFLPGRSASRVQVSMRVSRLQVTDVMTVTADGASQRVALPGIAASDQEYDTADQLQGPPPIPVSCTLDLHPGWNDVIFNFQARNGERNDLGKNVISAAVAADLAFTRNGPALSGAPAAATDPNFEALSLAYPADGLRGDPEVTGNVSGIGNGSAWFAVALARGGRVAYRLFPISRDGPFDIDFLDAFPNDWNDASQRVAGIWFLTWGTHPRFSSLNYYLHAMPTRALRWPSSLEALPLLVDGKRIGSGPVFLTRGRHLVASADYQVKIGLLSLEPATLTQTRPFRLVWQRRTPTAIDVSAGRTDRSFLLVFGEAYHPEWRATLDGKVLPHVVVDGVANGWIVPSLPAGTTIRLSFVSQQYYIVSALISIVALLVVAGLAWNAELRPRGSLRR